LTDYHIINRYGARVRTTNALDLALCYVASMGADCALTIRPVRDERREIDPITVEESL